MLDEKFFLFRFNIHATFWLGKYSAIYMYTLECGPSEDKSLPSMRGFFNFLQLSSTLIDHQQANERKLLTVLINSHPRLAWANTKTCIKLFHVV